MSVRRTDMTLPSFMTVHRTDMTLPSIMTVPNSHEQVYIKTTPSLILEYRIYKFYIHSFISFHTRERQSFTNSSVRQPTKKKKQRFSSFLYISFHFVRLFCKLSSSGSSDSYHFGGTRFVLSWETIVQYPRYKLRGQIRLKDTTLSLGSDLLLNHLFALQVCFLQIFYVYDFKRTREQQS